MKKSVIAFLTIFLVGTFAYAEEFKCDYKYYRAVKKVESYSTEMSEEARQRWIAKLKQVHELCKEGKEAEAKEILSELREETEWETVFSTHDGN
jgi:hypothetical protein